MLLATTPPYVDSTRFRDVLPPRIISEVKKSDVQLNQLGDRASRDRERNKIAGEILVRCNGETHWSPRKVSVRDGQLHVGSTLRIPLRRLSLSASSLPNSVSLMRGQKSVVKMQIPNESTFDAWIKTITIELIRQTPLEDIKYFDILTMDTWKRKIAGNGKENLTDLNDNLIIGEKNFPPPVRIEVDKLNQRDKSGIYIKRNDAFVSSKNNCNKITEKLRVRSRSCNPVSRTLARPEENIESLLRKCQNPEKYVPVREKLLLFETLCKLGSAESVSDKHLYDNTKRAKSLHDLTFTAQPVKEMRKYFETKDNYKRLINSDSNLNFLKNSTKHIKM